MSAASDRTASHRACPVCGEAARALGLLPAKHPLFACGRCGHRFAFATQADLSELYGSSYDGFREDPVFAGRVRGVFESEVVPRAGASGDLLDIGCGNGAVLKVASDLGFRATGVDVSQAAVDACTARGLSASMLDLGAPDFGQGRFDVVTFWDVLEHLIEPREMIRAAVRALRPGGWLLVKVPHHRQLSVAACAAVPRLSRSVLSIPGHLQFFTEGSLARLLEAELEPICWVPVESNLRSAGSGGSLKRRVGRRVVRAILGASGDGTLLALSRRRPGAA